MFFLKKNQSIIKCTFKDKPWLKFRNFSHLEEDRSSNNLPCFRFPDWWRELCRCACDAAGTGRCSAGRENRETMDSESAIPEKDPINWYFKHFQDLSFIHSFYNSCFFSSNAISLKRLSKKYAYLNSRHSHCEALRCNELRDEIGFSALRQPSWQRIFRSVTREIRHDHVGRTADRPSGNLNFPDLRRILEGNL